MRRVFNSWTVASKWAAQSQSDARSYGSLSFDGPRLYSYGTCIATIQQGKSGKVYLFTDRGYSPITAKHKGYARRHAGDLSFTVPRYDPVSPDDHAMNRQYLIEQYNAEARRLERAQYLWRPVIDSLCDHADLAQSYCNEFDLKWCGLDAYQDAARINAIRDKREARSNSPEGMIKHEKGLFYRRYWKKLRQRRFFATIDHDDVTSDDLLGWMNWWAVHSRNPKHLRIIKWRYLVQGGEKD